MSYGLVGAGAVEASVETMARLAGPGAEEVLAQLQEKAASSRCGMPETLRRFRAACLDGTFACKTMRATRERRARQAHDSQAAHAELRRELEKVRRLGVRVMLAGLAVEFARQTQQPA